MSNANNFNEILVKYLEQALTVRRKQGPFNLDKIMRDLASYDQITFPDNILEILVSNIESCGVNDKILDVFTSFIQIWDHEQNPIWSPDTDKYSVERRNKILSLLGFENSQIESLNKRILRFSETDIPIVIAENHKPWYEERKKSIKSYYWDDYVEQLKSPKGNWDSTAISILDVSTDDVLSRLSDPTAPEVYPVKGLVVGYVQSGKTSHFNGLIAKAADAGYRLIIILSGTTDILRKQTQRRIDKDIIGQDLFDINEYGFDDDWPKFVKHGVSIQDGRFEWERLTNKSEYKSLRKHPSLLEFKKQNPSLPYNHPDNLKCAKARIAVIKKVPVIINKLIDDLKNIHELKSKLDNVPTLIIDDESDQASINTIDQSKPNKNGDRTSTNKAIGQLLKLVPRAQYVGYTATPFANVFIDPDDADDLFPKEFIISLQRPHGYMGGSDFYDFGEEYIEGDFRSNQNAYIRNIEGADEDSDNLPKAIDSFVLSGAIKLFREANEPNNFKFQHHTMLIHHAAKQIVHDEDKQIVEKIFDNGARYTSGAVLSNLEKLFYYDFRPVSKVRSLDAPFPKTFKELHPYIIECISRLSSYKPVRIINGSRIGYLDEPDFEQAPIWAILVGGTKLSRGYTIEGLTTSYYRRPTGAGDTLMQMGRWYGFRKGYRDLVRLYIGRAEKRGSVTIDLYEAFGAVCRSEDELRNELLKYSTKGLKPKQVPPLVRQILPFLPPTSKNKMFNAVIKSQDFSGEYTEKISASPKIADKGKNREFTQLLLANTTFLSGLQNFNFKNSQGVSRRFDAFIGSTSCKDILLFLNSYLWVDGKKSVYLETDFIESKQVIGEFTKWQVLIPQLYLDSSKKFNGTKLGPLNTVERKLAFENTFEVYSEPRHREAAAFLAGVLAINNPSTILKEMTNPTNPVIVLYFVLPKGDKDAEITVGFGIQYPGIKKDISKVWGVRDSSNAELIVVDNL